MDEKHAKRLGAYLRQQREAKGVRVRALAAYIGIDMAQIVRLEHGKVSSPKVDVLTRVAEYLDLPLADVLAAAGYARPTELPSFQPYLRTKYGDLPPEALKELEQTFADITKKHGDADGPHDGEDEREPDK